MFSGCFKLAKALVLSADSLASDCYSGMFSGCKELDTIIVLARNVAANRCLDGIVGFSPTSVAGTSAKNPLALIVRPDLIETVKSKIYGDWKNYITPGYVENGEYYGASIKVGDTWWAPVNCGYDATNYTYGKLYQWGRKDGQGYDGDATYPSGDNLVNGGHTASPEAAKFYYGNDNWYNGTSPAADALWGATKTDYDPCPSGWRVPTNGELNALYGGNDEPPLTKVGGQNGCYFSGVFLPAAGRRGCSSGSAGQRGSNGYYWSSTVDSNNAKYLYLGDEDAGISSQVRRSGYSVRCVQE